MLAWNCWPTARSGAYSSGASSSTVRPACSVEVRRRRAARRSSRRPVPCRSSRTARARAPTGTRSAACPSSRAVALADALDRLRLRRLAAVARSVSRPLTTSRKWPLSRPAPASASASGPAAPLPTRIMKPIRSGIVTASTPAATRSSGDDPDQHRERYGGGEDELRQVAGEVGLERIDALHRGRGQLAGALARRGAPASAPAAGSASGRAARDITRVAPIRPEARSRRRAARAPPSRAASPTSELRERDSAVWWIGGAGDQSREQRGLGDDRRQPRRRRARRRATSCVPAPRGSRAAAGGRPRPGRSGRPGPACRRGRRATPLGGVRRARRFAAELARRTASGVGVPSKSSRAEAVAEDPVGPALVEQHDRHEDHGDDRHHDQRVVRGRGRRRASGRRRVGRRRQRVGEELDEQADEQQRDRAGAEDERAALLLAREQQRAPTARSATASTAITARRALTPPPSADRTPSR